MDYDYEEYDEETSRFLRISESGAISIVNISNFFNISRFGFPTVFGIPGIFLNSSQSDVLAACLTCFLLVAYLIGGIFVGLVFVQANIGDAGTGYRGLDSFANNLDYSKSVSEIISESIIRILNVGIDHIFGPNFAYEID